MSRLSSDNFERRKIYIVSFRHEVPPEDPNWSWRDALPSTAGFLPGTPNVIELDRPQITSIITREESTLCHLDMPLIGNL